MMKIQGIDLSVNCKNADAILDPVPPCFLSHLRCIKVYCCAEVQNQLPAIKNLLKNAVALDKIVISSDYHFARDFKKQLVEFPRGSKNCEFVMYWAFLELWLSERATHKSSIPTFWNILKVQLVILLYFELEILILLASRTFYLASIYNFLLLNETAICSMEWPLVTFTTPSFGN